MAAAQLAPPGESIPPDVWDALLARRSREWELPLISLEAFGIRHDADGLMSAGEGLVAFQPGAEASPYLDVRAKAVYKLFDLRVNGSLGKRISLELNAEGAFEIVTRDAVLKDTLEKLAVLNQAGVHPTEIVGLSDNGDYLVVKQPLAHPMGDFEEGSTGGGSIDGRSRPGVHEPPDPGVGDLAGRSSVACRRSP